ncbi:MAG: S-layer protein [archaeon]|nr:S-layer protein [archaeon]
MDKVVLERNGIRTMVPARVVESPAQLRPLLNPECYKIFERLSQGSSYPAQLAKELGINEQKAYYFVKQLLAAGLIVPERTEDKNGAVAKYYFAPHDSFAIVPKGAGKSEKMLRQSNPELEGEAANYLKEFTKNGLLSAKIVVGSPDPHGPYKARAKDGHLAGELSVFLGANCSGFELPLVFLDTMVKDLSKENSNLIILGGPVTNKLAEQLNSHLPIRFESGAGNWAICSKPSGKEYLEDSVGVIEKIPHPFFKGKWILLLAGKRNTGTIACILALAKKTAQTVKPNLHDPSVYAHVVEGFDLDGDGLVDEAEFRE